MSEEEKDEPDVLESGRQIRDDGAAEKGCASECHDSFGGIIVVRWCSTDPENFDMCGDRNDLPYDVLQCLPILACCISCFLASASVQAEVQQATKMIE